MKRIALVFVLACASAGNAGLAEGSTIGFGELTPGTLTNYGESGFTVSAVTNNWIANNYGAPAPAVVFRGFEFQGPAVSGEIELTKGGELFSFQSVELYSSVTTIPWMFVGYLGSEIQFSLGGQIGNTFGNFVPTSNPSSTTAIDRLDIRLTQPVNTTCPTCGGNPMGLDNIIVSEVTPQPVPEPATLSLLALGAGCTWMRRRVTRAVALCLPRRR